MPLEGFWRRKFKTVGKRSAYKVLLVRLLSRKAVSFEGGGPLAGPGFHDRAPQPLPILLAANEGSSVSGCHRAGTHLSHMLPVSDLYLRVFYMFFLKHIMQMFCPHVLLKVAFRKKALKQF